MEQSPGLGHKGPPTEAPAGEAAPSISNDYWDGYINEHAAAGFVGFTVPFLQNLRHRGGGPPYSKINKSVRYTRRRLKIWADGRLRTSTSDPGQAAA